MKWIEDHGGLRILDLGLWWIKDCGEDWELQEKEGRKL